MSCTSTHILVICHGRVHSHLKEILRKLKRLRIFLWNLIDNLLLRKTFIFRERKQLFFVLFFFRKLSVLHRDISDTTVPSFIKLDPNNLKMITTLIDLPFSLAENVVLDTLKNKITLHSLKELPELTSDLNCKKCNKILSFVIFF